MFNLEKSIFEWRKKMLAAGIKTPALLEELESHLREEFERQRQPGVNLQRAFEMAVQKIGPGNALKTEFKRAGTAPDGSRTAWAVFAGVFIGFILCLSGYTFFKLEMSAGQQVAAFAAVAASLLVACGWRAGAQFLPVLPGGRIVRSVGGGCIVSGFLCAVFICQVILPHFARAFNNSLPALVPLLLWAAFPIALGFGLACGLQAASRRPTEGTVS